MTSGIFLVKGRISTKYLDVHPSSFSSILQQLQINTASCFFKPPLAPQIIMISKISSGYENDSYN